MAKKIDSDNVVYFSPEGLAARKRAYLINNFEGSNEELIEAIDEVQRNATGEYRVVKPKTVEVENAQGDKIPVLETVEVGDLVVWIDEAPGDNENPSGYFEAYSEKDHGETYDPLPVRPEPTKEGE